MNKISFLLSKVPGTWAMLAVVSLLLSFAPAAYAQDAPGNLVGLQAAPKEMPQGFVAVGSAWGPGGAQSAALSALFPFAGNPAKLEGVFELGVRYDSAIENGTNKKEDVGLGIAFNRRFVTTIACEIGDLANCIQDRRPFVKVMANFSFSEFMAPVNSTFSALGGMVP